MLVNALVEYEPAPSTPGGSAPPPARPRRRAAPPPRHPTPARNEPGPTRTALWRLLAALVEALDGRRQMTQLRPAMALPVYEAMLTWSRGADRHRLRSLHTCRTSPTAVEMCASVRVDGPTGWRLVALAGRIESVEGVWRLTALRLLLPGTAPRAGEGMPDYDAGDLDPD